jgi:hypothetical protein
VDSSRCPWNNPHSSNKFLPLISNRYIDPVVVREAPMKWIFMCKIKHTPTGAAMVEKPDSSNCHMIEPFGGRELLFPFRYSSFEFRHYFVPRFVSPLDSFQKRTTLSLAGVDVSVG